MCDSFLLCPKHWTYHGCCIYGININCQWRFWGNLNRQEHSGAEDPTKGGRRAFLASKTWTVEKRDGPNTLLLSWQWGSCDSEAALTQQHGHCLPSPGDKSPPRSVSTCRIWITCPLQSSSGIIALWGGALVWLPLSRKPSHPCCPKSMYCLSQSPQKHIWPS